MPNPVRIAAGRNLALVLVVLGVTLDIDGHEVHKLPAVAPPVLQAEETGPRGLTQRRRVTLDVGRVDVATAGLRAVALSVAEQRLAVAGAEAGEEQQVNALVHLVVHKLVARATAAREVAEVEVRHVERAAAVGQGRNDIAVGVVFPVT